jgi:protein-disulfide isomerase
MLRTPALLSRFVFTLVSVTSLFGCAGRDGGAPCPNEAATTAGGEATNEAAIVAVDLGATRAEVPIAGHPSRGPSDALVTIVEITDFQCPFCSRVQPAIARLLETYPGVRLVVLENPLPMHAYAVQAAEAALEAYAQGGDAAYFRMYDLLFQNQGALETEDLVGYAASIGLDADRLREALEDHRHRAAIEADVRLAAELGADGTPAFFVDGRLLMGARPYEDFEALVLEEQEAAEALIAQGLPRARIYDAFLAAARAQALE